ncbi:hypothetical protein BDC45DRAFT_562602 [Circinella umbellata]|nr:hypothetical protein BDC45DRAFT_562602 [Circinella umbellata]
MPSPHDLYLGSEVLHQVNKTEMVGLLNEDGHDTCVNGDQGVEYKSQSLYYDATLTSDSDGDGDGDDYHEEMTYKNKLGFMSNSWKKQPKGIACEGNQGKGKATVGRTAHESKVYNHATGSSVVCPPAQTGSTHIHKRKSMNEMQSSMDNTSQLGIKRALDNPVTNKGIFSTTYVYYYPFLKKSVDFNGKTRTTSVKKNKSHSNKETPIHPDNTLEQMEGGIKKRDRGRPPRSK